MDSAVANDMNPYAVEVLSLYSITEPEIEFIRHNENITFKVTDKQDNKTYLLRIHKPSTAGLYGIQHTLEGLESEMYILQGLARGEYLPAQKPVAGRMGQLVTAYTGSEIGSCYATLLTTP
jgi:hypothetical protein